MISVIVPVYNTKVKLLNRCLNSILNQSYKQIQLVIIDDASSSLETKNFLQDVCKKDNRLFLIAKEKNEGVDAARFTGIENSCGEWLAFVDSDDWLEKDALNKLMKAANDDVDIVIGSHNDVFCGWKRKSIYEQLGLDHKSLMDEYFVSFFGCNKLPVTMWGALYRKYVVEKASLAPSRLKFGEDLVFNMQIIPYTRKMHVISDIVYNYNHGMPGYSTKYMDGWLDNAVKLFEFKYRMLEKYPNKKCERFQAYEMINYLKSYVRMVLMYDKKNIEQHKKNFEKSIESPIFEHLHVLDNIGYRHEKLVQSILKKDYENSWRQFEDVCEKISRKCKVKEFVMNVFFVVRRSLLCEN